MPFVTQVATTSRSSVIARSSGGKVNIQKQGLNSVKNDVVRKNLQGVSDTMKKNDWVDASGRKGAELLSSSLTARFTSSSPSVMSLYRSRGVAPSAVFFDRGRCARGSCRATAACYGIGTSAPARLTGIHEPRRLLMLCVK